MEVETHVETHAEMEVENHAEMEAETRMEAEIDRSRVRREGPPFEVLRAVVAQFNADQLLTERPQVSALVQNGLTEHAKNFNIVLDDVAITHLSYGAEFSRAVEQKQEVERSKFVVAKAEQERCATIIRAEGESESAKMISKATEKAGTRLVELRKIKAMRENAATLAKSPNVAYLPGGQQILSSYAPNRRPFL